MVSLWSGVDAPTHGAGRTNEKQLALRSWDERLPMLPAELQARGYVTAAFVANDMLALMPFSRMFDHWRLSNTVNVPLAVAGFPGSNSNGADARDVVDAAIRWIDRAPDSGWLSWVHVYEPHLPYRHTHDPELNYNLARNTRSGDWFVGSREQAEVRKAYGGEVAYAERQLMRLIDVLDSRGILDHGIVVFSADHGEELWDHSAYEHGHSHHGEVTDVPLVFIGPGVAPAKRSDLAALEDIAPTIRKMLEIPTSHPVDLRAPIPGTRVVHLGGTLYRGPMHSYRWGHERLIIEGSRAQEYDLARDPREQHPLETTAKGAAVGGDTSRATPDVAVELKRLRTLGYVN
ncbi:MAG TPA: sulfatase-like hydrolase/transferase [Polyangiales bacterium]|nr:sulfatase-like hydrolase/transferase [Polyangiales bacterium]